MNRTTATCIAGMRSKTTSRTRIHFFPRPREAKPFTRVYAAFLGIRLGHLRQETAMATRAQPVAMMGSWMLMTGLASLFAGDFSGMIPEPTGTTTVATNAGYAKLFTELGLGSLAVGSALVVLIETHSLPTLVRCYPCSFTFYVSDPSVSFRFCAS